MSRFDGTYGEEERRREAERFVAKHPEQVLCPRCGGTGNELYSMYRQCSWCGGLGTLHKDNAAEWESSA